MFNPGEKLTLRSGKVVVFIAVHPHDGALLIGEFTNLEEDITEFETFERCDVSLINGQPKPMSNNDRLNFVIPVAIGFDSDDTRRRAELLKAVSHALHRHAHGIEVIDEAAKLHGFKF